MRLMALVLSVAVSLGFSVSFASDAERARESFQKFLKFKAGDARNDWNRSLEYYRLARLAKLCEYDEDSVATCLRSLRNDKSFDGKKICVGAESRKDDCEKEAGAIEEQIEKYRKQMSLRNRDGKIAIGRRAIREANTAAAREGSSGDGQH